MKKLKRGISRVFLYLMVSALIPIELLDPRIYMWIFCGVLSRYGVKFTGTPRYISSRARFDDLDLISIGERSVISKHVILLTHDYSITTALIGIGEAPPTDIAICREIVIGANVFIGMGAILLPGARIGDNVIIGAGSVVRGVIPPDSIIVGNPAQRIGGLTERAEHWRLRRDGEAAFADLR